MFQDLIFHRQAHRGDRSPQHCFVHTQVQIVSLETFESSPKPVEVRCDGQGEPRRGGASRNLKYAYNNCDIGWRNGL